LYNKHTASVSSKIENSYELIISIRAKHTKHNCTTSMIFKNLEKGKRIIEIITFTTAQRSLQIKNVQKANSINQLTHGRIQRYYYST
jgi:hypothetical protein